MAAQSTRPIEAIIQAPVVSADSQSPEAQLMRNAKRLEAQAAVDTRFDPVLENFTVNKPLLGLTVALSLMVVALVRTSMKTGRR
jgi:hypothetical protein